MRTRTWDATAERIVRPEEAMAALEVELVPPQVLPPIRSDAELAVINAGRTAIEALQQHAKITLVIDQLRATDPETNEEQKALRRTFLQKAQQLIMCPDGRCCGYR